MTRITTFLLALVASMGALSFGSQASADVWHHLDEQALSIEKKVRALTTEAGHYRHTSEYVHIIADTRDLARLASQVHSIAHNYGSLNQLAAYVRDLDLSFHHIENLFDRVESHAAFGDGHVHGNTRHVKRLLTSIENSIHHLQSDLASLQRAARARAHTRTVVRRPDPVIVPGCNIDYEVQSSGYRSSRFGHGNSYNSGFGYSSGGLNIQGRNFGIDNYGITLGRGTTQFRIAF